MRSWPARRSMRKQVDTGCSRTDGARAQQGRLRRRRFPPPRRLLVDRPPEQGLRRRSLCCRHLGHPLDGAPPDFSSPRFFSRSWTSLLSDRFFAVRDAKRGIWRMSLKMFTIGTDMAKKFVIMTHSLYFLVFPPSKVDLLSKVDLHPQKSTSAAKVDFRPPRKRLECPPAYELGSRREEVQYAPQHRWRERLLHVGLYTTCPVRVRLRLIKSFPRVSHSPPCGHVPWLYFI